MSACLVSWSRGQKNPEMKHNKPDGEENSKQNRKTQQEAGERKEESRKISQNRFTQRQAQKGHGTWGLSHEQLSQELGTGWPDRSRRRGEIGTGSHSKVTRGQGPCFQLLADVHGRKVLRTCPAWRVSQNLLMDLALVWQEDTLQAVVMVVEVEKMWWGWSPEPEVRGQVEAHGGWGVMDKATGH